MTVFTELFPSYHVWFLELGNCPHVSKVKTATNWFLWTNMPAAWLVALWLTETPVSLQTRQETGLLCSDWYDLSIPRVGTRLFTLAFQKDSGFLETLRLSWDKPLDTCPLQFFSALSPHPFLRPLSHDFFPLASAEKTDLTKACVLLCYPNVSAQPSGRLAKNVPPKRLPGPTHGV